MEVAIRAAQFSLQVPVSACILQRPIDAFRRCSLSRDLKLFLKVELAIAIIVIAVAAPMRIMWIRKVEHAPVVHPIITNEHIVVGRRAPHSLLRFVDLTYERPDGKGVCHLSNFFTGEVKGLNQPGLQIKVAAEYPNACGEVYLLPVETGVVWFIAVIVIVPMCLFAAMFFDRRKPKPDAVIEAQPGPSG